MDIGSFQSKYRFSELFTNRAMLIPVDAIGLPARALNIIISCDAKNSYEASLIVAKGFVGFTGVGTKTISESEDAIGRFVDIVESATEGEIKLLIDPREEFLSSAKGNLAEAFPAIIDLYFSKTKSQNPHRDHDIIKKRFGLNGVKKYILEDLGAYYDVTRERVRQIESKSISNISLLLRNNLNQKGWTICCKLQREYLNVVKRFSDFEWIILREDIDRVFHECYADAVPDGYLDLFMEVCGYIKLPNSISGFRGEISESWCLGSKYKKNEIESIFQALDVMYDTPNSITLFDLVIAAKKRQKSRKNISNESLKIALSATNDIDFDGEKVAVKFTRLRSAADKAFRILESHRKPVHFSKITQEINFLGGNSKFSNQVKETNLKNQLVADKRFTPIGRSGEWGLTDWDNINNITIVQAIEKVLHTAGGPLSFTAIEIRVKELRPDASSKSLTVYLNDQPLFTRVGKNEFALSAWRMKAAVKKSKAKPVSVDRFNQALKEVFVKKNPIDLATLISELMLITGHSRISVRQKILATNGIDIAQNVGSRDKTISCSDLGSLDKNNEEKVLLIDKVQSEIRSILFERPNVPFKKGDLYKEVKKGVECLRPTFYRYLELMNDIHQYKEGNDYYAVLQHEEVVEKIEINVEKYSNDESTKEFLRRALSLLTLDNVDIALFELGLKFENTLKNYLLHAKNKGEITVNSKDMLKLANMVDCVVREKIVTKGHHLSTLREERNNRAHGEVPSIAERRELFNKAHYISDLFVKYICFFRAKML
ncbi:sigma factor-like helix-turn-helix DNA-binding protein [Arsukibacterium sp.]|uniref:sigma factor-like helix-turn-helix DNA-binding protein n=1 Tax=Arsukibacterium sp. TaxID=1977258 RepID=UPI00299CF35C|nr:sigma factor-like helix-turn-helix DNA-binding protein [Arsukibacterium sp.]MDX1536238.1 sigma factor-like helix-turn-helix DNA-binding protein [Arsukibacterium sp.]